MAFEDFNFDGEKEIVISGDNGIYIYDRKTGKEKNSLKKRKLAVMQKLVHKITYSHIVENIKKTKKKKLLQ